MHMSGVKLKHRDKIEKSDLIKRLNIIEGQIKGIKQMIENDRYCNGTSESDTYVTGVYNILEKNKTPTFICPNTEKTIV